MGLSGLTAATKTPKTPKTPKFKVIGCVLFISDYDIERKGYQEDISAPISLIYQKGESDNAEMMYYKTEGHMKILYSYLVDRRYTLEEAREIYPELFL